MPTKIPTQTTSCPDCKADVLALELPVVNPTVAHAFFGKPKPLLLDPKKVPAVEGVGRDGRDAHVVEVHRVHACPASPYDDLPKDLETFSDRELALRTAFEIVDGTLNTRHVLNLARCHIEVAAHRRPSPTTGANLRERYPVPDDQVRLGSFCPECGPNVTVDEDGCCSSCGNGAIGEGADDALRALLFVAEHDDTNNVFIEWLRSHPLVEDEDGAPYPPQFFDHVAQALEDARAPTPPSEGVVLHAGEPLFYAEDPHDQGPNGIYEATSMGEEDDDDD